MRCFRFTAGLTCADGVSVGSSSIRPSTPPQHRAECEGVWAKLHRRRRIRQVIVMAARAIWRL